MLYREPAQYLRAPLLLTAWRRRPTSPCSRRPRRKTRVGAPSERASTAIGLAPGCFDMCSLHPRVQLWVLVDCVASFTLSHCLCSVMNGALLWVIPLPKKQETASPHSGNECRPAHGSAYCRERNRSAVEYLHGLVPSTSCSDSPNACMHTFIPLSKCDTGPS